MNKNLPYLLEREIQFDAPIPTVMKYFRVLIASSEREIEPIDRQLDQRTGLDGVEIIIPHPGKIPTGID